MEVPPETQDNLGCVAGYNAGACLGYWERRIGYTVRAGLWDVASARAIGRDEASVTRTLGVLGVLLPIPFTHSNQNEACERLGRFARSAS